MARRRFIYDRTTGEMVEVDLDYQHSPQGSVSTDSVLWNDRSYQDMNDPRFSSRAGHREYMRQNGLATADDYRGVWKDAEKRRIAVRNGFDPGRRSDIERSIHQLREKGRK